MSHALAIPSGPDQWMPDAAAGLRQHIASWPTDPATPARAAEPLRQARLLLMQAPDRPATARQALTLVLTAADQLGLPRTGTAAISDALLAVVALARGRVVRSLADTDSRNGGDDPADPQSCMLITLVVTVASAVHELAADPAATRPPQSRSR
jgi:hypothetical protein